MSCQNNRCAFVKGENCVMSYYLESLTLLAATKLIQKETKNHDNYQSNAH